jgi:iron complex transport system permease protein
MTAVDAPVQGRMVASGPVQRWGLAGGLAIAAALVVLAAGFSLAVGSNQLPLSTVWHGLSSPDSSFESTVIASRIPRTVLGLLVGAALAVAGAVLQGITRNPLADPGLLGINSGASVAIVIATVTIGSLDRLGLSVAIPGAFAAAILVYIIGSGRSGPTPVRLVLSGAAVTAVLGAVIQAITLTNPDAFDSYRFWVVGSLAGRPPETVRAVAPLIVVGLLAALALGRSLNTLALGDETARAVGANASRTRLLGVLIATVLAGAATATVGPIAFVGLAVPHSVRTITGSDYRWLIAYCIALGPVLLLGSDIIGRVIARPGELMVGVVTAFVGAPFLYVAVRRTGSGL